MFLFKSNTTISPKLYPSDKPYRVIIVGGSFGGLKCLSELSTYNSNKNLDITLVEPKQYMEYTPSILHAMVDPDRFHSIHVPMSEAVVETSHSRWIQGSVVAVDENSVSVSIHQDEIQETRVLPFDCLFLAHGSQYASPIKAPTASLPLPLIEDILATTPSSSADGTSLSALLSSLPGDLRLAAFLSQYSPLPPPRPVPGSVSPSTRTNTLHAFRNALLFGRDPEVTRQVLRDRAMATGDAPLPVSDHPPLFSAPAPNAASATTASSAGGVVDGSALSRLPAAVSRVRIIGGGLVGVELAAEIAQHLHEYMVPHTHGQRRGSAHAAEDAMAPFIDAKTDPTPVFPGLLDVCSATPLPLHVELHTNTPTILTGFPEAVVKYCTRWLREHGVSVVVNSNVDLRTLASDHGDMVCVCAGVTPSVASTGNRGGRACDEYSDSTSEAEREKGKEKREQKDAAEAAKKEEKEKEKKEKDEGNKGGKKQSDKDNEDESAGGKTKAGRGKGDEKGGDDKEDNGDGGGEAGGEDAKDGDGEDGEEEKDKFEGVTSDSKDKKGGEHGEGGKGDKDSKKGKDDTEAKKDKSGGDEKGGQSEGDAGSGGGRGAGADGVLQLERGFIKCESTLLTVRSHAAVQQWLAGDHQAPLPPLCFAVGDACSNAEGGKMALTAETQATTAVHNLMLLLGCAGSKRSAELVTYPEYVFKGKPPFLCCISLGTEAGVTVFNDMWFKGSVAVALKAFIGWSKVRECAGWRSMGIFWHVSDTLAIWSNVAYRAITGCFGKAKED